ncbi:vacuolar-type H+-ATPase subunit H [Nocardioides zeae]|uniref:Vacuolar-type H+-ATPase subunit H n=1 Tax=Nocardioides zeae TaxID=1457234 RepID=A0ACC6IM33_9ACTN|nr:DUF3618 domain-containing protein [Nocardioides zeae]MDR6173222.1 vacuolar-type H+-ATPase subunit H [Nocardioides zeae]MDR6211769.1 vacuolar-type H+-ATPase subunit H [Nocardioides zeae]
MGQSPEELTAEIARTRGALASDLDELQDKVSPSAIVDRKKAAARDRVLGVREKVMGGANDARGKVAGGAEGASNAASNAASQAVDSAHQAAETAQQRYDGAPLAAGVAVFGLGMVISALLPASKVEARAAAQVTDTIKEQAAPLVDDARAAAADVGQSLRDSAASSVEEVKQTAQDAASHVQEEGASSAQNVRSETTG